MKRRIASSFAALLLLLMALAVGTAFAIHTVYQRLPSVLVGQIQFSQNFTQQNPFNTLVDVSTNGNIAVVVNQLFGSQNIFSDNLNQSLVIGAVYGKVNPNIWVPLDQLTFTLADLQNVTGGGCVDFRCVDNCSFQRCTPSGTIIQACPFGTQCRTQQGDLSPCVSSTDSVCPGTTQGVNQVANLDNILPLAVAISDSGAVIAISVSTGAESFGNATTSGGGVSGQAQLNPSAGHILVYRRNQTNNWALETVLTTPLQTGLLGVDIAMNDDGSLIFATWSNLGGNNDDDGVDENIIAWAFVVDDGAPIPLTANITNRTFISGVSIDASADGFVVVVGAVEQQNVSFGGGGGGNINATVVQPLSTLTPTGVVVFRGSDTTWTAAQYINSIIPDEGETVSSFFSCGSDVAISSGTENIIFGCPLLSYGRTPAAGRAFLFSGNLSNATTAQNPYSFVQELVPSQVSAFGLFGQSVDISNLAAFAVVSQQNPLGANVFRRVSGGATGGGGGPAFQWISEELLFYHNSNPVNSDKYLSILTGQQTVGGNISTTIAINNPNYFVSGFTNDFLAISDNGAEILIGQKLLSTGNDTNQGDDNSDDNSDANLQNTGVVAFRTICFGAPENGAGLCPNQIGTVLL